jgi:hypothetical protein
MARAFGTTILAAVIASGITASAHHSHPVYFDMSKVITVEGEIVRMEWINPHVLLYLQSRNDKGQAETWILHGHALGHNGLQKAGSMKERLKPGALVSARAWPPRNPLYVNDVQTVLLTKPEDPRKSSHIAGAGEVRFSNGDIVAIGPGPKF